jgi:hypothetical protein
MLLSVTQLSKLTSWQLSSHSAHDYTTITKHVTPTRSLSSFRIGREHLAAERVIIENELTHSRLSWHASRLGASSPGHWVSCIFATHRSNLFAIVWSGAHCQPPASACGWRSVALVERIRKSVAFLARLSAEAEGTGLSAVCDTRRMNGMRMFAQHTTMRCMILERSSWVASKRCYSTAFARLAGWDRHDRGL